MLPLKKIIAGICLALLAGIGGLYWYITDQEAKKIAQFKALVKESNAPLTQYDSISYSLFNDRFTIVNLVVSSTEAVGGSGVKVKQLILEGCNMDMLKVLHTTVVFKRLHLEGVELRHASEAVDTLATPITLGFLEIKNGKANMAALVRGIEANRALAFFSLAAGSIEFEKLRINTTAVSNNSPTDALLAPAALRSSTGGIDYFSMKDISAFSYGPSVMKGLNITTPELVFTLESAGVDAFTFGLGGIYNKNLVYTIDNYRYTNMALNFGDADGVSVASVALSSSNTHDAHATTFAINDLRIKGYKGKGMLADETRIPQELYPILESDGLLISLKGALKGGKQADEFTLSAEGEAEMNIMGRTNATLALSGLIGDDASQPFYMDVVTAFEEDRLFFETGTLMAQSNDSFYIFLKKENEEASKKLDEFKANISAVQSTPVKNYLLGLGHFLTQPGTLQFVASPEKPVSYKQLIKHMKDKDTYLIEIIDLLGVHTEYTPFVVPPQ